MQLKNATRNNAHVAALLRMAIASLCLPTTTHAQVAGDQDTRLRLDQQVERQRRTREAELVDGHEALDTPNSLEIDGQTYSISNNVDEIGKALFIVISRKRWQDVRRFLNAYESLPEHDPMLVLYAKGGLAREHGDPGAAEQHYRDLLALNPGFLPAQLELARVLFENRKDREARRAFETVRMELAKEGEKAASVIRTVEVFLVALKRRREWQGSIAIGPSYSTNVNQSSASYTCLLQATDGTCLIDRQLPAGIKATGINFEATLGRDIPLAGHSGIKARAFLFGDVYPAHHEFSQVAAIGRLGYQYQTARNAISLSPSLEVGSLGSSVLYKAPGVNVEWTHILSRAAMLRIEGNYRDFRYRLPGFNYQDGPLADVSATAWYMPSPSWTLFGGPDFADKSTPNPVDTFEQWGCRIGVSKNFSSVASLLLLGSYRNRQYSTFSELLGAKRREDQFNATAIARFPALQFARLVPEVIVQHTRVESNIDWLYSYKRTTASVRLSHAF